MHKGYYSKLYQILALAMLFSKQILTHSHRVANEANKPIPGINCTTSQNE